MVGGKLLSRRRVPKTALSATGATTLNDIGAASSSTSPLKSLASASEDFITHEDLSVGANLPLYGRTYHLWACDQRTRSFLKERFGIDLPEDEIERIEVFKEYGAPPPFLNRNLGASSPFETSLSATSSPEGHASDKYYGRRMSPEKRFIEAIKGSGNQMLTRGVQDKLGQWLAHDSNDCLRFVGVIDEREKEGGGKLIVTVKHFLADDTVEVVHKTGHSSFETLWKKNPLPKKDGLYHDSRSRDCFDDKGEADYYHLGDLRLGMQMKMAGRRVLLVDADDKTMQWYATEKGIDMQGDRIDISEPAPVKKEREIPPYMGWGTEEDSLASMKSLIPQRPRKDWKKIMAHSGEVLRYTAKFAEPKDRSESERYFTISYEVATEMIR
jgi:DUF1126 PH-like domain